jgi:hypothetical protein
MDARERRLAQNEALYREVNERISEQAERHDGRPHALYQFLCECSNLDCNLRLDVTLGEYEAVRAFPRRFVIAPDHHLPDVEQIVADQGAFCVIEKEDEAGKLVEQLDPRSG